MSRITTEKLDQAQAILTALDIDAWLVFVRESSQAGDPALGLVYEGALTWQTALLVTRQGDRIAVVGQLDDGALGASGDWTEVVPYVQSVQDPLLEVLKRVDPATLALNYSVNDYAADGLSHGMFLLLQQYLAETPYGERFVSAEAVVSALRGRKSPKEVQRMRKAIEIAEAIFAEVADFARPGITERQVAEFMLSACERFEVTPAWEHPCPIVNSGPDSMIGHGVPGDIPIEPGHVLHIDFGVRYRGYCSDLQRCWYVPKTGETSPPAEVAAAFGSVASAIELASRSVRPGICGWELDAIAREAITKAGYPEYDHALGHQVGRCAHDGGAILGPPWPRYGETPKRKLEAGNVLTLEPSICAVGASGCIGLEEMVLVTDTGCEWLSQPQRELPLLG